MLDEKVKKQYKDSLPLNWVLAVTYGLLLAGAGALCAYSGILALLFSLILFLPLFFSLFMSFYSFRKEGKQELTFGKQISFFGLYFSENFKGTFSFWKTFLVSFIIFVAIGVISAPIGYAIANSIYPGAFNAFVDEMNAMFKEGFQYSKMMDIINKYYYVLNPFMQISTLPPFFLSALYYLFGTSYSSLSFYFRASTSGVPGQIVDLCCSFSEKANRKSRIKDYFKEHWLYLVLYVAGFWVTATICIVFKFTSTNTLVFSVLVGTFIMSLYYPFYFPKMEQMYERHKDEFSFQLDKYKEKRRGRITNIDSSDENSEKSNDENNKDN